MKEYKVQEIAKLAGVSARTIRFYDETGLLKPAYINESGYRIYGDEQVDRLQQILLYRQMHMPLSEIKKIMLEEAYDKLEALKKHKAFLESENERVTMLLQTVNKTIRFLNGEIEMTNKEKFEGFKKELVAKNEEEYGSEIRKKYGEEKVAQSNEQLMGLTEEQYAHSQKLAQEILDTLHGAIARNEGAESEAAQKACALHKEWLLYFWPEYDKEAHRNLGAMYVADERFKAYYDSEVPSTAQLLADALQIFAK